MLDDEDDFLTGEDLENEDGELFEHFRLQVDKGQTPIRIDKFLTDRIANASRTKIQVAADAGNILVNEKAVKSNYKIKPLDLISIVFPHPPREIELKPEDIPINIVYEDDHVLVLNKPAGLVVHPGYGNYSGTLVNALLFHFQGLPLFMGTEPRPGLVHRLDKDTTGLMVIAKTELALNKLAKQFFDRTTQRTYIALVWGDVKEDEGTINANLGRHPKDRKLTTVFPDGDQGKTAITHYKVLERLHYVTLVQCKLQTGRTHQIRAHFKYIGHTLFGDVTYGGDEVLKGTLFNKYKQFVANSFEILPRQALHAKTLGFFHPATNEFMQFDSDIPADIKTVAERWRQYVINHG